MLENLNPARVLFFDIETASCVPNYAVLDPILKKLWDAKVEHRIKDSETSEQYFERESGLSAEFGRVVCISVGKLRLVDARYKIEIQTFSGDEAKLLGDFADMLNKFPSDISLCSYNGKEFDVPFLCRRMLLNGFSLPDKLDPTNKKPWDSSALIDPMFLWRFGEFRHYTKMDLLAHLFGIPSSKGDIEGAGVSAAFWRGELERIVKYCQKDVVVLASILLKLKRFEQIQSEDVIVKNETKEQV